MRTVVATAMVTGWLVCCSLVEGAEIVYPSKGGTLADGGMYGPFDGVADNADWRFDGSGYDGAITLSTGEGSPNLEHRVVWAYDLGGLGVVLPVTASLTFPVRGAPIFPFPDVDLHVYTFPADLRETLDDFHAGPTVLQGRVIVSPRQPPTEYSLDVSAVVNEFLLNGSDKAAFRFQVDPDTPHNANQAFIDALDSDPSTKPFLTIDETHVLGDMDGDGDVDVDDFDIFAHCVTGPDVPAEAGCETADLDTDGDIDLLDWRKLQIAFTGDRP